MDMLQTMNANFRIADALDIAFIALLLYIVFVWLRQRASRSLIIAFTAAVLIYMVSRILNMHMTSELFRTGFVVILVALVVVFSIDIRRIFEHIIAWDPFLNRSQTKGVPHLVEVVVQSVSHFADHHIGALIVFVGKEPVEPFINGGTSLDGEPSFPILSSIFDTSSEGHDGAILIAGNKITHFGVRLPSSDNTGLLNGVGTRHAAALGLSERCDAVTVVVSEERGTMSIAHKAKLMPSQSSESLTSYLESFYRELAPPLKKKGFWKKSSEDAWLKIGALCCAAIIWLITGSTVDTLYRTYMVPVELRNLGQEWIIQELAPTTIRVSLSGLQRDFNFDPTSLVFALDLSNVKEGKQKLQVNEENLSYPARLTIRQIQPKEIDCNIYQLVPQELPVKVVLSGKLPNGKQPKILETDPRSITLLVRKSYKSTLSEIKTEPIILENIDRASSVKIKLVIPEYCRIPKTSSSTVIVRLSLSDTAGALLQSKDDLK
ncbi:MAG: diadenylate cyclase [Chitinivibrionales bacterium]|nr:diadenylate cyclase [Chitinivibrionales bacterium]